MLLFAYHISLFLEMTSHTHHSFSPTLITGGGPLCSNMILSPTPAIVDLFQGGHLNEQGRIRVLERLKLQVKENLTTSTLIYFFSYNNSSKGRQPRASASAQGCNQDPGSFNLTAVQTFSWDFLNLGCKMVL